MIRSAHARSLHLTQRGLNPPPILRVDCVPLVLEIPSFLRCMSERQVASRLPQLAGVLLNFYRLHVEPPWMLAMEGIWEIAVSLPMPDADGLR